MPTGVLKGFGLDTAELVKAKDAWLDVSNTSNVAVKMSLTQREAQKLEKLAAARNPTVDKLLNEQLTKSGTSLLK